MNRKLFLSCLWGFLFVSLLGSAWHFFYQWSGENTLVGFIAPINESVWEHMKLLYFPMALYGIWMYLKLRGSYPCLPSALLYGILLSTFLVPVIFYTYTGILGKHTLPLDLITFFISVLAGFTAIFRHTKDCRLKPYWKVLLSAAVLLLFSFLLFTCSPPLLGLFKEP